MKIRYHIIENNTMKIKYYINWLVLKIKRLFITKKKKISLEQYVTWVIEASKGIPKEVWSTHGNNEINIITHLSMSRDFVDSLLANINDESWDEDCNFTKMEIVWPWKK